MTTAAPPAGRYGPAPDPRRRRLVVVGIATLGALGVAAAVWLGLASAAAPVHWSQVGFSVDGPDSVDVTFQVTRSDPATPALCTVEAQNSAHGQVGVVEVDVPASTDSTVRLTTTVRTSETAVTGLVTTCRTADASPSPDGGT